MGRERKKGKSGTATQYMTRSHAVKKLQVTLQDFRKLCILKGIYPREPKKKIKGTNKTYYLTKDINFLMHDPLLEKFRLKKTFRKKIRRAKGRGEEDTVRRLQKSHPTYRLDHIVKERYPTFIDALRDLDDALCLVHLFAKLPQTAKIPAKKTKRCARLCMEFQNYIASTHSLRKVFLSVKGIYYQAEIQGVAVTWLTPYTFSQNLPKDVDFRIMITFLEFYTTLMGFVLFKLYSSLGFNYPPTLDSFLLNQGEGLAALVLESKQEEEEEEEEEGSTVKAKDKSGSEAKQTPRELDGGLKAKLKDINEHDDGEVDADMMHDNKGKEKEDKDDNDNDNDEKEDEDDDDEEKGDEDADNEEEQDEQAGEEKDEEDEEEEEGQEETTEREKLAAELLSPELKQHSKFATLFSGCYFFLSREVPRESLEFVIKSFGGQVSWDGCLHGEKEASDKITHHILDRPTQQHRFLNREYVQPQWIYDCANVCALLPIYEYAPGVPLPPHLSPFVDNDAEGYTPKRQEEIDTYLGKEPKPGSSTTTAAAAAANTADKDTTLTEEQQLAAMEKEYAAELAKERGGLSSKSNTLPGSSRKRKTSEAQQTAEEEDEEHEDNDDDEDEEEEEEEEGDGDEVDQEGGEDDDNDAEKEKEEGEEGRDDYDENEFASYVLSHKKKKMWDRMQRAKRNTANRNASLMEKRRKLEEQAANKKKNNNNNNNNNYKTQSPKNKKKKVSK